MPPPRTQTKRARPTEPECSRTPLGEMKMPEPMMFPAVGKGREASGLGAPSRPASLCSSRCCSEEGSLGCSLEGGLEACGRPRAPQTLQAPLWPPHFPSPALTCTVTPLSVQTGSLPEMSPVPNSSASHSHEVGQAQAVAATPVPPHRAQVQPLNPGQGLQACQPPATSFLPACWQSRSLKARP